MEAKTILGHHVIQIAGASYIATYLVDQTFAMHDRTMIWPLCVRLAHQCAILTGDYGKENRHKVRTRPSPPT
jgi:hypothetical protein